MRNSAYGPDSTDIVRSQICYAARYICIGAVGLVIESIHLLEEFYDNAMEKLYTMIKHGMLDKGAYEAFYCQVRVTSHKPDILTCMDTRFSSNRALVIIKRIYMSNFIEISE